MSSTNKTTYYELSQYVGTDKATYLSDYNGDMLKIDTGIHNAASDAGTALSTANSAASAASTASTNASAAVTTANTASATALDAKSTAETAATNASAALTAASAAETAAAANTITNLAPAYDPTLTYSVDDLVTYIDGQGSGKLYKCIIAVDTPEAFNINKWDDVTTSEVYGQKTKIVAVATGDGVKTYGNVLDDLYAQSTIDITKEYLLVIHNDTASPYTNIVHTRAVNASWYNFTDCGATTTNLLVSLYDINGTASKFIRNTVDANGFTSSDKSSDIVPATMTLSIYELGTV